MIFNQKQNDKEQEIISLKEQLKSTEQIIKSETEKAYQDQLNKKELEIKQLQSDFNQKQSNKEQEVISLKEKLEASTQLTKTETQKEYQEQLNQKDLEISKLNAKLEQILSQNTEVEKIPVTIVDEDKTVTPKIAGLSESTVAYILEQLDIFEKEQQFLDSKITQKLLSEKLGTNPTYLSKIINAYKGKNFSNYLNDLRLEYIVELLKTEHQFLEKEIKELANIAGFTNAEAFSDNFQRKFEIKPSYFIKMMKENIKTSSL